jgi:rhodanese-related sulfurtransferase
MSATRGILGALSLVAARVPNDVYVLLHGTRGWLLDGFELETHASRFPQPVSSAALERARARAMRIAEVADLSRIDAATLEQWRGDASRTTYVFDVRSRAEYLAGHLPGSHHAPEGTIVMSPDHYFATLNGRIVLVDDDTVRATVTALWLAQMGWGEVAVLAHGLGGPLETGLAPAQTLGLDGIAVRAFTARELDTLRRTRTVRIIDVGTSEHYIDGHIAGAVWCSRATLGTFLRDEAHDGPTVLTSEDGILARLAAGDLDAAWLPEVSILAGGNRAWRDAGYPCASGAERLASPRDDHWLASSERPGDMRQNVIDYLAWEESLLDDIERGGMVPYRNLIWR